uniref:PDZ domain-containing protein n=1 Tax=Anabas testudineus TaxID=64144 RepID=A0A3Q1J2E2_ANATE
MCDCFHLAFPNWHAASSGTAGRRLRGPEPGTEGESVCDEPSQFTEGERPRPQGSSPVEEYPETEKYTDSDQECEGGHEPHHKSGSGKKTKKSGLGSMFEKRSTPKMSKLKEAQSPESGVIVKTAKDGCAEGLVYGGGGKEGIFIKEVVPESPASKSLKLQEGDQILSATVYFDNMSYEDAIQILEHAQAYKVKLCLKHSTLKTTDLTVPRADVSFADTRGHINYVEAKEFPMKQPKDRAVTLDVSTDLPHVDINIDRAEMKTLEREEKESTINIPNLSISIPKIKGSEIDLTRQTDVSVLEQKMKTEKPELEVKPLQTDGELDGQKSKFKMPKLGIKMPKIKGPEFDLNLSKKHVDVTLPEAKGEVILPEVPEVGSVDLSITEQRIEVEKPELEIKPMQIEAEVKPPEVPEVGSVDVLIPDQKIEVEKPEFEIKPLQTEGELDAQGTRFKMPKLGIKMPKIKGPEFDLSLSKKDVDVTLPEAKAEVKLPEVPEVGAIDLSIPEQRTEAEKNEFEVKPLQAEGELDGEGIKFKMPKFGIKMPKIKGPEFDLSLSKKDTEVLLPEAKAEVKLPKAPDVDVTFESVNVSLPEQKMKIKEPELEVQPLQTEDVDVALSQTKLGIKMPKIKGPEFDLSLSKKDVDVTLPEAKAEVKLPEVPEVGVKPLQAEGELDGEGIKFKMPKFGIKMPKIKGPEFDLSLSKKDTEVLLPEAKAEVKLPKAPDVDVTFESVNVSLPEQKMKIKEPELEVQPLQTEEQRTEAEKTEFEVKPLQKDADVLLPEAKAEDVNVTIPEVNLPEVPEAGSVCLSIPEHRIEVEKPELEIKPLQVKLPDVELKQPSAEVEAPEIKAVIKDKKGSPSKFKMPTFKFPKFGVGSPSASVDVPDMDKDIKIDGADIKIPEEVLAVSIEQPSIEGPSIDLKTAETEHEVEGGKFKLPTLGFSVSKAKGLDTDLNLPKTDVDVTLPEVRAEVKLPDVELKQPSAEVEAPEIKAVIKDKKGSPSKFKMPTFKFPKFGIGSPSASVDVPDMDKDIKIDGVDIKIPEEVLAVSIEQPSIEAKGLDTDLNLPKTDVDVTLPEVKAEVKLPDVELKQPSAEVEAPEIKAVIKDKKGSPPKFKMPTFKFPKFGIGSPSASVDVPDMDKDMKIDGADIKIPEEVLTVSIAQPSIEGPSIDLKTAETEHEVEGGKFKLPTLGFSVSKAKGLDTDLKLPKTDVDVTLPEVKAEVKLPDVELKQPSAEVEAPEIKAVIKDKKGSPSKFKMPTFKFPKFGVGSPSASVDVPDMDKDIKIDGADIEIPEEVLTVSTAQPSIEGPSIDLKTAETEHEVEGGKFKLPTLGFSVSKAKGLDTDLKLPKTDVDVTLPEVKAEVKLPDVELKQPSAEVEAPEIKAVIKDKKGSPSKFKMPTFKFPKFGIGSPNLKTAETEHEVEGGKFKLPTLGFSVSKAKGLDTDLKLP